MRTRQAYNQRMGGAIVNSIGVGPATRLTAAVIREDEWYVARCLEVEITSQGSSLEEAVANLREALELYFEDTPLSHPLPAPVIAPVDVWIAHA